MSDATSYEGGCHCGALRLTFVTARPVGDWAVRACGCSFCRAHNASHTSDPAGRLELRAEPGVLGRYSFGHGTADFLFCTRCSVYLGAVSRPPEPSLGVVNVNVLRVAGLPAAEATSFDGEEGGDRLARRRRVWTPFQER
jgi:hypothetical protein